MYSTFQLYCLLYTCAAVMSLKYHRYYSVYSCKANRLHFYWECGVNFKVATFVHRSLSGISPTYLADDCRLVADARERRLCSTESRTCVVARTYSSLGDRAFAAAGPVLWNSLPSHLKEADLPYSQFRRSLKTFLFGWWGHGAVSTVLIVPHRNDLTYLVIYWRWCTRQLYKLRWTRWVYKDYLRLWLWMMILLQAFRQLDVEGSGELDVVQLRKTLTNYPSEGPFTDISSMVNAMKHCALTPGQ